MTGLIAYSPPSPTRITVSWLLGYFDAGTVGMRRPNASTLPYRMVNPVAGTETTDRTRRCGVVSVHSFAASMDQAEAESDLTHQRMLAMGPPFAPNQAITIVLGDSSTRVVTPDYITTTQIPIWADYEDDLIFRFVARYEIGLRFV
jgi:hypothetical protein